jgi:uncharacterized protein (TIGR03437 family)
MPASWLLLAASIFGLGLNADDHLAPRDAPFYSRASVVNAADNQSGAFAPNTIGTIYGTNLAYATVALSADEVHGGTIPSVLPGTGVEVLVGGIPAGIYYVCPTQINFLIPSILTPGPSDVLVAIDGLHGPDIPVQISAAAPAFFQLDAGDVIATLPDGTVITPQAPAKPGDIVVLYATGLGAVVPPLDDREVSTAAQWIQNLADLKITLDGAAIDSTRILYAGVAPGFAGLYQINLQLPATVGANPAIRATVAGQSSPAGLTLPVEP